MKKVITLITIVFFSLLILIFKFNSKDQNSKVITKIEEKDNTLIAINYPQTKYSDLNKKIKNYINSYYSYFKDEFSPYKTNEKIELNIDYSYFLLKSRYLCITIYVMVDTHNSNNNYKDIKTILYDTKTNKEISLINIINDYNKLVNLVNDNLKYKYNINNLNLNIDNIISNPFSISDKFLTIYIPSTDSNYDFFIVKINLKDINLETKQKIVPTTHLENNLVIDPSKKVVALTFDDGPSIYTKDILEILNKYGVSATFFVLGNKVSMYKETLKTALKQGCEIGNHSYNHKWMIKLSESELKTQIEDTQNIIKKELGYTPTSLRPTYGSVNNKIKSYTNFNIVLWNIDTLDWKIKNPKEIARRALKADDSDIILMHDIHKQTVKSLEMIIPKLLKDGFQFVTISELKEIELLRKRL